MADKLVRFGVSIEESLMDRLDAYMKKKGSSNRSELIRDLIREKLNEEELHGGEEESIGLISLVFDHHQRDLAQKMTRAQHDALAHVVASMHVHIDKHNCLEALAVRGRGREIQKLGDRLTSAKGVKHGSLSFTTISSIG